MGLGGSRIASERDHNVTKFHFVFFQSRFYSRFTMDWLRVGSDEKLGSFCHVIMFSKMVFISSLHENQLIGFSTQDGHVSRSTHSCYCSYFPENFRIRKIKLFVPFVFFVFKSYSLISSFNFCYPLMFVRRWRTSTKLSSLPLDPFKFCNLNIFPY